MQTSDIPNCSSCSHLKTPAASMPCANCRGLHDNAPNRWSAGIGHKGGPPLYPLYPEKPRVVPPVLPFHGFPPRINEAFPVGTITGRRVSPFPVGEFASAARQAQEQTIQDPASAARLTGLDGSGKENPKAAYGKAKPQLGLVPPAALIEMAGVMETGAVKYGATNWRKDHVESMTYVHAALRHTMAWLDGEDVDPESGFSHLAHAASCFAIVLDAKACSSLIDNRPLKGKAGDLIRQHTKEV